MTVEEFIAWREACPEEIPVGLTKDDLVLVIVALAAYAKQPEGRYNPPDKIRARAYKLSTALGMRLLSTTEPATAWEPEASY